MFHVSGEARFKIGEVVSNSESGHKGVVYDFAYDASPNRTMFYGVLWSNGTRTWESFHSLISIFKPDINCKMQ